jgi:hypothetical protein
MNRLIFTCQVLSPIGPFGKRSLQINIVIDAFFQKKTEITPEKFFNYACKNTHDPIILELTDRAKFDLMTP